MTGPHCSAGPWGSGIQSAGVCEMVGRERHKGLAPSQSSAHVGAPTPWQATRTCTASQTHPQTHTYTWRYGDIGGAEAETRAHARDSCKQKRNFSRAHCSRLYLVSALEGHRTPRLVLVCLATLGTRLGQGSPVCSTLWRAKLCRSEPAAAGVGGSFPLPSCRPSWPRP